jgi:hypothetical protein
MIALEEFRKIKHEQTPMAVMNNHECVWARLLDDFFYELKNTISSNIFNPIIFIRRWYSPYKNRTVIDPLWSAKDLKPGLALLISWVLEPLRRFYLWLSIFWN